MSEIISFKETEQITFQVVFLDGLTELLFGLTFFSIDISAILGYFPLLEEGV